MSCGEDVRCKSKSEDAESYPINLVVASQRSYSSVGNKSLRLPSYQWRWFGKKGMTVVLLWSFAVFTLLNYVVLNLVEENEIEKRFLNVICISIGAISCPVVGWLTDAYIGRYRVIKSCLITMVAGSILHCGLVAADKAIFPVEACLTIVLCLAIGAFQVNILQFSTDQLRDASSEEIVSFIIWYVWTYFTSKGVVQLLACTNKDYNKLPVALYVSVLFTVSVSADALFNHWLTKEPVTPNPLKLILKVLQYAAMNKYPRHRSAFMYWDNKCFSRINLAKTKYGGPFTAKQVEDVKSFFQILGPMAVGCLFFGFSLQFGYEDLSKFQGQYSLFCARAKQTAECLKIVSVTRAGCQLVALCVPLYKFILLPFFRNRLEKLRILTLLFIGGALIIVWLLGLVSAEVAVPSTWHVNSTNLTCKDYHSGLHPVWCDSAPGDLYYWLLLLSCVHVVGQCVVLISGLEFICAQAPYSMKGIIVGSTYSFVGLSLALVELMFLPFRSTVISVRGVVLGCMFWFLLACVVCAVVLAVILGVASHCYKNREREEREVDTDTS